MIILALLDFYSRALSFTYAGLLAMKVLVTGSAGFIGSAVSLRLLARGDHVIGVDDIDPYYAPALKRARLLRHASFPAYTHLEIDLAQREGAERVFAEHRPERIVHLAAQPGVRHAMVAPHAYVASNVQAFLHVLEGARRHSIEHLVFASSSSVYGLSQSLPFSVHQPTAHPISLYAATKLANEAMAHSYAHLYRIPTTGLRFFTVYGPYGRPDMAPMIFARAIERGRPIELFDGGRSRRDFTYIDDIVEGVVRVLDRPARPDPSFDRSRPDPAVSDAPYRLYNIGNASPVAISDFLALLERYLGKATQVVERPRQEFDLTETLADVTDLERDFGFVPSTPVEEGVRRFVEWFRSDPLAQAE